METDDDVTVKPEVVNGHSTDDMTVDDIEDDDGQNANQARAELLLLLQEMTEPHDCQGTEMNSPAVCPGLEEQLELVAKANTSHDGAHSYAISRRWLSRWRDHVTINSMADAGAAVEMDNEAAENEYVPEAVWKLLSSWYGVSEGHLLDRKHNAPAFNDHVEFEVCTLSAFSGIVDHITRTFNRFEEVGYIEFQLRRLFHVTSGRSSSTRLWLSERELMPPRFRLLANRNRMLKDGLRRDRTYILALEARCDTDYCWPTGEPGDPVGDLEKYFALAPGLTSPSPSVPNYQTHGASVLQLVAEDLFNEGRRCLERRQCALLQLQKTIESTKKELDKREAALNDRRSRLSAVEKDIEQQRQVLAGREDKLVAAKSRQSRENELIDDLRCRQQTRLRLDVGGTIFVTSRRTLVDRDRKSLLAAMFPDHEAVDRLKPEVDGSYFVDRDGVYFRYVIDWLRKGDEADLPCDVPTLRHVLCEAKFYRLCQLVKRIEHKLTDLNASIV